MMARGKSAAFLRVAGAAALGLVFTATAASAGDAASFYKGKVLTLVVGYGPGGGYDTYARMLAPHIERRTGATVVVQNRPGGGSLVALNQVYDARPDGLTIMLVNGVAAALGQLTQKQGVRYDLLKITWLARVAMEDYVWLVSPKSPYRSVNDVLGSDRPIKFAAGGKTDGISDLEAIICRALVLRCKIIIGYKGSKESALAVIRGEADAFTTSASSGARYAKKDTVIAIASMGRARASYFKDVPTIFEQVDLPPDRAWWIDFHEKIRKIGRGFATSPGVPQSRVAYLQTVLGQILTDPDVAAEAARIKRHINYLPATDVSRYTGEILGSVNPNRLKEVRRVLLEAYF